MFPSQLQSRGDRLVEARLSFTGRVIDFRTNFGGNAFLDTLDPNLPRQYTPNGILTIGETDSDTLALFLPQPVQERDVINFESTENLQDRNSLSVVADISNQSKELVTNLRLTPAGGAFTPNGDGVNDELEISFDIQRLLTAKPVQVEFYDLGGRRVNSFERRLGSGGYSQVWDGRDESGNLVAPGIYLLRLTTKADAAGSDQVRIISVAY